MYSFLFYSTYIIREFRPKVKFWVGREEFIWGMKKLFRGTKK